MLEIRQAESIQDWQHVAQLFREFKIELGDQLHLFEAALDADIAALPGPYVPPRGALLLAFHHGDPVGCLGLKPFSDTIGEVKRMYVRPAARGLGVGRRLLDQLIAEAKKAGYQQLYLDSLKKFVPAHRQYYAAGFQLIPPYNALSGEKAFHMALSLAENHCG